MVARGNDELGLRLPDSYIAVLYECNGGYLRRSAFPKKHALDRIPTICWHADHLCIHSLMGIGEDTGLLGPTGSAYLIREWGYPEPGVVISTEGHEAFMLDYRDVGATGEPPVVYVDLELAAEPSVYALAPDFGSFVGHLICGDACFVLVVQTEDTGEQFQALLDGACPGLHWREPLDGFYEAGLPGTPSLDGDELRLLFHENRYSDGSGWSMAEYPECPWVVQLDAPHKEGRELAKRIEKAFAGRCLLVHEPPVWPSGEY